MASLVFSIQSWISLALTIAALAIEVWAFIEAARSRPAAYPAVNRLSRTLWLVILGVAALLTVVSLGRIGILALIGAGVAIFYLVDVRPKVREVTPTGRTDDGPYAGW